MKLISKITGFGLISIIFFTVLPVAIYASLINTIDIQVQAPPPPAPPAPPKKPEPPLPPNIPTPTPDPTSVPTNNPTPAPTSTPGGSSNGGGSSSSSSSSSSDPGTPAVKVLGASAMAKTGGFEEALYQTIMSIGGIFTLKGIKNIKKVKEIFKRK